MSTFTVTVEQLTILPHLNADTLELAEIGLYRAVVAKGLYQTGDLALYIPEQAILPNALIDELRLTGKLAGPSHNRVKAVRLRGELSQGIVARPQALAGVDYETALSYGEDFSEFLGISKWVPEVPVHMSGQAVGTTELLPWVDVENIKRFPSIFSEGESVTATEKIHGSCTLFTLSVDTGEQFVSSKGLGARNLALTEADDNLYWRTIKAYDLAGFARNVAQGLDLRQEIAAGSLSQTASPVAYVGIFGEVYGAGIQDLTYGTRATSEKPGYAVFDIAVRYANGVHVWLDQDDVRHLTSHGDVPMVPELYRGPYDPEVIAQVAEGKETISGHETNVREGVVVRPIRERRSNVLGGRAIGKWVSEGYLTRKGGTEYE